MNYLKENRSFQEAQNYEKFIVNFNIKVLFLKINNLK